VDYDPWEGIEWPRGQPPTPHDGGDSPS
jgi:hypothetical protein